MPAGGAQLLLVLPLLTAPPLLQVGKWDAGMATRDHTPHGRGYDTAFGYFCHSNDYWNQQVPAAVSLPFPLLFPLLSFLLLRSLPFLALHCLGSSFNRF